MPAPRITELEEVRPAGPVYSIACVRWLDAGLALLPVAIARVRKFAAAYGTDDPDGDEITKAILLRLAVDLKDLDVFVALFLRGRRVIGHYVIGIDQWMKSRLVNILQFELDEPVPIARVRAEIDAIEKWGRSHGCTGFQAFARNETLARAFRTFRGFKYHATVLRRSFAAEGETAPTSAPSPAEN